jgi:hypothetical protein
VSNNCTCAACVHARVIALWRELTPFRTWLLYPHSRALPWARGVVVVRWGIA